MQVFAIVISLLLLTYVAYRGYSVIVFAPICAVLATLLSGGHLLPTYTQVFLVKGLAFATSYFPVFLLGAIFGKVMETGGLAVAIADWIMHKLGAKATLVGIVLSTGILGYGGVSVFVIGFAVYPLGAALFKEADIPKRLLPGTLALGLFTFAMTCFPGTPQIQNIIPTKYFGTDSFAAPVLGTVAGLIIMVVGLLYLQMRVKSAKAKGEGYGEGHINEPDELASDHKHVNPALAALPLIAVLVLNYVMTKAIKNWDPEMVSKFKGITLAGVAPIWALIVSLVVGVIIAIIVGWKNIKTEKNLQAAINGGAAGSLLAIMNTSSEVGYGSVVSSLPGFAVVSNFLMGIFPSNPLVSEAITINVLAGVTGSASGGMSIALEAMGAHYLQAGVAAGISPEVLHKIASLSSGGFDSLPHNGAVITLLAICGLTHKQSYRDIGVISVLIPFATTFVLIILMSLFS
ncbi:citrate transporter [Clostridium homopropionicum DSM 5847]|uniref:Citrate transporter n=1 Tax=Clostridium homopropionicum DSM 5847 TaxID=1121318 RepID=A0A0L6Z5N1_9CLOT|nr:GntP family permease [Clostridium homopropionicum]KOA18270.1 citrate transporter [Clostridium homopropionicum DSM 5847]SFF70107.1 H+/gluconate symporter [Clostridium homopropionicum]